MNAYSGFDAVSIGLVADVGRSAIRLGLTDPNGRLDHASVREYDPSVQSTISTAIAAFTSESGLRKLPSRAAIAVSGVPRGDTISVLKSRWILSRSGLAAMFRAPPLILNDFAANAWAVSDSASSSRVEPLRPIPVRPQEPGTYCIIGMGSGLGVALLIRDDHGMASIVPTEGGQTGLMDGVEDPDGVLDRLRGTRAVLTNEMTFSAPGLLALYRAFCAVRGRQPLRSNLSELLSASSYGVDSVAAETFEFYAKAFWHFAGNMALAYGAWDGVILTGSITRALKPLLRRPELARGFALAGPYANRLRKVPQALVSFRHAELEGAAIALLVDERRRALTFQPRVMAVNG